MNQVVTKKNKASFNANTIYTIKNNQKEFEIYLLGNQQFFKTNTNHTRETFLIDEENFYLYRCFDNLFSNLSNKDFKDNKIVLVSDDKVNWKKEKVNRLEIVKLDNYYQINFINPMYYKDPTCTIRIDTTKYNNNDYIRVFTNLYYDLEIFNIDHQFTLNDYIKPTKVKQLKKF